METNHKGSGLSLTMGVSFSSGHLYKNEGFNEEANRKVFGRCYTPYGHGHDYRLEAQFALKTVENLEQALQGVLTEVAAPLDHHHLNFEIDHFKKNIPTTENIASYLYTQIQKALQKAALESKTQLQSVRLYEGTDIWSEVSAGL